MILAYLDPRVSRIIRLAGLGFVVWSLIAGHPAPGVSGRSLVITVLGSVAVLAWLAWLTERDLDAPPRIDIYVLAGAGGGLVGAAPHSAASVFVFVAIVSAGLRAELARALQIAALGTLGLAVSVLVYDGGALGLLAYALGFAATALAASNVRQFRARADQAELLLAQTQRSHEEQLRSARLAESTRIAREIHDVLAHSLAGLTIQLEATTALIEADADRDQILARVRRAHELAREGLRETRRAVGALRGDPISVPGAIRTLASEYRSADQRPAELVIEGDPGRLAGDAGLAVLRIVQEGLTNASKHAPGSEVTITVRADEAGILAAVENRRGPVPVGAGPLADSGGGFGLQGMRERAAALGGTISAGPSAGGWRVELRLPALAPAPAAEPAPVSR
jgi:signal transduction histidine kinase